jgi:1-acyl-sn-glycerol-3-phosphate acyltransferase
MHHIPVDRAAGLAAYHEAVGALTRGELVGVFPESTISRAYVPRSFKTGAARMALESGVPLLPVVVWGGHRVWTTGRRPKLRRGVPVVIEVGAPIDVPAGSTAAELTAALYDAVNTLTEKVQRSYPAPESADQLWWQPAYLGGAAPTLEAAAPIERAAIEERRARKQGRNERRRRSS